MYRRYIIGALLGAFLGFVGFCITDCVIVSQGDHLSLFDGSIDRYVAEKVSAQDVRQGRNLILQGAFLYWLISKGEFAGRAAAVGACLGISFVLAVDRFRQFQIARKDLRAS